MDIETLREYCISKKVNKKHWNTILPDGSVPDKEVFSWIDHSEAYAI
jgi:predicted DNA-binding protein (MmcQ/YjbR family)